MPYLFSLNAFNGSFLFLVQISKEHGGIMRFIQVSCLGASPSSPSRMLMAKAAAEEAVLRELPEVKLLFLLESDLIDVATSNGSFPPLLCNQRKKLLMEDERKENISFFFCIGKEKENA